MGPGTVPARRGRPTAAALAWLGTAAIISAMLPVVAGLAFLISLAARRPLITAAPRRWPWLAGIPPGPARRRAQVGLTAAWGVGMLAVGAVQAVGAVNGSLGITNPASFAVRALIALAA